MLHAPCPVLSTISTLSILSTPIFHSLSSTLFSITSLLYFILSIRRTPLSQHDLRETTTTTDDDDHRDQRQPETRREEKKRELLTALLSGLVCIFVLTTEYSTLLRCRSRSDRLTSPPSLRTHLRKRYTYARIQTQIQTEYRRRAQIQGGRDKKRTQRQTDESMHTPLD